MNDKKYKGISGATVVVFIAVIFFVLWMTSRVQMRGQEITFTQFEQEIKDDNVTEVVINQNKAVPTGVVTLTLRDSRETGRVNVSDVNETQKLLDKCLGLSLSDQYWIRPIHSDIQWSEINFFEHSFSEDVGNILFGRGSSSAQMSLMSPDNTSDGWLKKKWKIIDGKRCLIKGGSGATQQEPYNEVLASRIMERLSIPHVPYRLLVEDDYPYSVCEDFITPQTELISAWYIMQTMKKPNNVSVYQHYLNCCEAAGIPGIRDSLDRMMVVDYLIANEDRHQNNFGVVRNAETLEYLGAAPLFDSGTSLWFDKPTAMIGSKEKLSCKPFKNSHKEQIKLVTSFDWLDLNALQGIEEELRELVRGSLFIDEARCDALCRALKGRVDALTDIVNTQRTVYAVSDCRDDVKEDVTYSGSEKD